MRVRAIAAVAIALAVTAVAVVAIGLTPGSVPDAGRQGTSDAASSAESPASGGLDGEPSSGQQQPYSLPPSAPRTPGKPLVSNPLPKSASARGELVAGFPVAIIPLVPGASVLFSSVATPGSKLQVGLEAIASIAPADVIAHYSAAFSRLGLVAAPEPATGDAPTATFTREGDSVTVTAASYGGSSCRFTVFGVFSPGT